MPELTKILIISPDYYGIERSIVRAFERNGLLTYFINARMRQTERVISKIARSLPASKKIFNPIIRKILYQENLRYRDVAKSLAPSLVLVIKGDSALPETIKYFKTVLGVPCFSYQWDNPFPTFMGTAGGNNYRDENFNKCAKIYDHIFIFDKSYVKDAISRGISNVSYLPLAADDEKFHEIEMLQDERKKFGHEICFVGMPYENRIQILNALEGFDVGVYGDYWKRYRHRMTFNYYKGKAYDDMVKKIYCASKIVLNINHSQSKQGVNARTFEIPCCGAFEIVNYVPGLEELFDLETELVCYKDVQELRELASFYLVNEKCRHKIIENGYKRVMRDHLWTKRVKDILIFASKYQ